MDRIKLIEKIRKFPDSPGVYMMRDDERHILYIGKATSLRRRVLSYFQRPQEARIEQMISKISNIETKNTDSAIEALLLESNLIKLYQPKYNIRMKDNKTYLGILVTDEDWPRVLPARITDKLPPGDFFGPFPSGGHVREALQIIRKIFPFRVSCVPLSGKACFEYHLGMCPGVCAGKLSREEYRKIIGQIKLFLRGRKKEILAQIEREMNKASRSHEFEVAAKLRDRLFALKHIQDVALIKEEDMPLIEIPKRIEAYDVSNISGEFAVGSMVVFSEGLINKNEYRKFRIKSVKGANDVASLKEVLVRRLNHEEWQKPELILVDGGLPQVNMAKKVLAEHRLDIPVIGLAKGPNRNKNEFIGSRDLKIDRKILIKLRDEAHRFAIEYYRMRHKRALI